jgi:hypothetical protein
MTTMMTAPTPLNIHARAAAAALAPTVSIVEVTPALAREWLGRNTHNRNIRPTGVAALVRDMRAGRYLLTGQGITFDRNGVLIDGQHRLNAIIEADVTVPLVVLRGADPDAQMAIDVNKKRTYPDHLALAGRTNATTRAAILRRAMLWERGIFVNQGGAFTPTYAELDAFESTRPLINSAVEFAMHLRRELGMPPSIGGVAFYVFAGIDYDAAVDFLGRVADGENISRTHPAYAFRSRFTKEQAQGGRIPESELLALLIRAWNAYRTGSELTKLQLPKGGLTTANFPRPI